MVTNRALEFEPDYAIPPGATLREVMDSLGMNQKQVSIRTGLTEQSINRILQGKQPITPTTASRLELVTGVPAQLWNSLETNFRTQVGKIEEHQQLSKDLSWLKIIPTRELIQRGAIEAQESRILLLRETLRFYGVSSVAAWKVLWESPNVAARRSICFETRPGPASAWIRLGELQATQVECKPYERSEFLEALKHIRELTTKKPKEFMPEMTKICAEAGVALALVKELRKVPWHGATKWLTPEKPMILLSLRGKGEDQFWFSFFHEASHVLHDNKKDLLINDNTGDDPREKKANEFAAAMLIPEGRQEIPNLASRTEVVAFARRLRISPGIVVGQYEYMTGRWGWYKDLKRRFTWV